MAGAWICDILPQPLCEHDDAVMGLLGKRFAKRTRYRLGEYRVVISPPPRVTQS